MPEPRCRGPASNRLQRAEDYSPTQAWVKKNLYAVAERLAHSQARDTDTVCRSVIPSPALRFQKVEPGQRRSLE